MSKYGVIYYKLLNDALIRTVNSANALYLSNHKNLTKKEHKDFGPFKLSGSDVFYIYNLSSHLLIYAALQCALSYDVTYRKLFKTPSVLSLGKVYKRENNKKGYEEILTTPFILSAAKQGRPIDCEDLSCDYSAELINEGKAARPLLLELTNPEYSETIIHVVTQELSTGKITDVSEILGMDNPRDPRTTIRIL